MIGKIALLQKPGPGSLVCCTACHWYCQIPPNFTGVCGVRLNYKGKLKLLTHSWPTNSAIGVDPIEKKPLYHFLPGTPIFSLGTLGCCFACDFCQNWTISQSPKLLKSKLSQKKLIQDFPKLLEQHIIQESTHITARNAVDFCLKNQIPSIAFTYTEPAIFTEYAHDVMKLAKKHNIKGVFVSDGYESPEALKLIDPYIDAFNIDLKGASEEFYWQYCHVHLEPVLQTIRQIHQMNKWLEITTLLVPGLNTSQKDLAWIAQFIHKLSPDIPWHITSFYPAYKMMDIPPTDYPTLHKAYRIGKQVGLNYVYTGNIPHQDTESTYCPNCQELLISRRGFQVNTKTTFDNKTGKCTNCRNKIPGIWN